MFHSKLGASSAHRWLNCAGSVKACEGVESVSSKYADEGTMAHAYAERCLREGAILGGASKEMLAHVEVYLQDIWLMMRRNPGSLQLIEHKFALPNVDARCFGTCDHILLTPTGTLYVHDLKYGAGVPVEVENNPQLLYYALGAMLSLKGKWIKEVVLTIVQPRCPHPDGPVRTWKVSPLELYDFMFDLSAAVAAADAPDAPRKAGDWCKFCDVKGTCGALKTAAYNAAADQFGAIEDDFLLADPTKLTSDELASRLAQSKTLKVWLKALETYAIGEARQGRLPTGLKLVATSGKRKWADSENAAEYIIENFPDNQDEFFTLVSPAQAEKLVSKDSIKDINALTIKGSGGVKFVPLSDKKPAITAHEFENIEDQDDDEG